MAPSAVTMLTDSVPNMVSSIFFLEAMPTIMPSVMLVSPYTMDRWFSMPYIRLAVRPTMAPHTGPAR